MSKLSNVSRFKTSRFTLDDLPKHIITYISNYEVIIEITKLMKKIYFHAGSTEEYYDKLLLQLVMPQFLYPKMNSIISETHDSVNAEVLVDDTSQLHLAAEKQLFWLLVTN